MENYKEIQNDEIEIDLKALFFVLWRKAWLIILAGLLCGGIAFGYTKSFVTPLYKSTSAIYVVTQANTTTSYSDLQLGAAMTEDYQILSTSRTVVDEVVKNLNLDYKYNEFVNMISVNNPTGSHIIQITVTNPDPEEAMEIANEMADVVAKHVAKVMSIDEPTTAELAVAAENPSSPSVMKNTAIGMMLGFILVAGLIVLIHILDDTVKTEDDVMKYLGKDVLAVLPKEGKTRKEAARQPAVTSTTPQRRPAPTETAAKPVVKVANAASPKSVGTGKVVNKGK